MARPRTCSVKYFCLGACLIFLGSVLLCALGFTIVLPHDATRLWPEVVCHVTNASYDRNHCACDQQVMEYDNCLDTYPCLRIAVVYNISTDLAYKLLDRQPNLTALKRRLDYFNKQVEIKDLKKGYKHYNNDKKKYDNNYDSMVRYHGNPHDVTAKNNRSKMHNKDISKTQNISISNNGIYHDSMDSSNTKITGNIRDHLSKEEDRTLLIYGMVYRRWSDSFHKMCSLYECGDSIWNVREVKRFRKKWARWGKTFPCYFDPFIPEVAVIQRTTKSNAIHAILWPALCLFTGSLIWMGMCFGCWKIETEQPQNSSTYYRGIL